MYIANPDRTMESFLLSDIENIAVTSSKYTDPNIKAYSVQNQNIKDFHKILVPTSAGENHIGGASVSPDFKIQGEPVDVAFVGRRPVGILLKELTTPGNYIIYRKNNQTFITTEATPTGGELLNLVYQPQYLFFEFVGGGGGSGGSSLLDGGQGGGGGAYIFNACCCNNPIYLTIGSGGRGGDSNEDGYPGEATILKTTYEGTEYVFSATGGSLGHKATDDTGEDVYPVITPANPWTDKVRLLSTAKGAGGGGKNESGRNVDTFTCIFDTPEQPTFTRGALGGICEETKDLIGNTRITDCGGGGGACAFTAGAFAPYQNTVEGTRGAGASGHGHRAGNKHSGARGGDGVLYIYY